MCDIKQHVSTDNLEILKNVNVIYVSENDRKLNTNKFINRLYYLFYKLISKNEKQQLTNNTEYQNKLINNIISHFKKLIEDDIYTINICDELKLEFEIYTINSHIELKLELDNKFSNNYNCYYYTIITFKEMIEDIILLKQSKDNKDYEELLLSFTNEWMSKNKKNIKMYMNNKSDKINNIKYINKLKYIINEILTKHEKNNLIINDKNLTQITLFKINFISHLEKLINKTKYNSKIFNEISIMFLNNDEDVLNKKITKFNYDILFVLKIFLNDIIILKKYSLNEFDEKYQKYKIEWSSTFDNVILS